MSLSPSSRFPLATAETQHAHILAYVQELERVLASDDKGLDLIVTHFADLRVLLERHFIFEETNLAFRNLLRQNAPEKLPRLERLIAEHGAMREEFARIEMSFSDDIAYDGIAASIRVFLTALRRHESAEDELLINLHSSSDGTVD